MAALRERVSLASAEIPQGLSRDLQQPCGCRVDALENPRIPGLRSESPSASDLDVWGFLFVVTNAERGRTRRNEMARKT